jgi:membrane protease YdiL (CAAX protease family)
VGALYVGLRFVVPTDWKGGTLARFIAENPDARVALAAIAMLYAPLFEELLFRGLMLRGMTASWGVRAAGIVVTVLFFLLHLPETFGYWPASLAILGISVVTLFARLRTGSLAPAIAAHFGYNLIAVAMLFITPRP